MSVTALGQKEASPWAIKQRMSLGFVLTLFSTREKASSSVGFRCISSAGSGATNKALQLTHSSSACSPALLLHKCSSSAVSGSSLLLVALAHFSWTRYCYRGAAANFYTLATANLSSFLFFSAYLFCI